MRFVIDFPPNVIEARWDCNLDLLESYEKHQRMKGNQPICFISLQLQHRIQVKLVKPQMQQLQSFKISTRAVGIHRYCFGCRRQTLTACMWCDIDQEVSRKLTPKNGAFFRQSWVPQSKEGFSTHKKSRTFVNVCCCQTFSGISTQSIITINDKESSFCIPCVLFLSSGIGGLVNTVKSHRTSVTQPLKQFDVLTIKRCVI